ncbi:hypothetical protein [Nocardia sp. NPDC052112]|uniref:hypothetical protein n=1 Tax=Nocardia sp. NPDC052112 TaxID=3155646 RepID=UPI00343C5BF5
MDSAQNGEFLFDSGLVGDLEQALNSGFREFQSIILTGIDPADVVSGAHGTGVAEACVAASSAVGDMVLGIALDLLTMSTNVRTVIDTVTAHDSKRAKDTQQLMGDLG